MVTNLMDNVLVFTLGKRHKRKREKLCKRRITLGFNFLVTFDKSSL